MTERNLVRRTVPWIWIAAVAAPAPLAGDAPRSPAWVEIEPNAIQRPEQPMRIEVGGLSRGETVRLAVLQDCDGDGRPDDDESCPLLLERASAEADARGVVSDEILYADLEAGPGTSAENRGLWLRVRRPGGVQARWARFGYVEDPCSLWSTVVDTFLGGECNPGLTQALRQHRGPSTLEDVTFEVRWIDVESAEARPRQVSGSRGATGVAWEDPETLLVTIAPTAGVDPGEETLPPGLYRFGLDGGAPTRLWHPADAYWPTAPHPLPGERIAFVRQRFGIHDDGRPPAYLSVLAPDGEVVADHPLHRKIHQVLAHDLEGEAVLALTLGEAENRPAFLRIVLTTGEVHPVGYHHALYHAALRSPSGDRAVVAFENTYADYGWDLVLVDEDGGLVREIRTRKGHDLLPAWRPTGGELAYLGEIPPPGEPESEEDRR